MRLFISFTLVLIIYPMLCLASKKVLLTSVQTLTLYAEKFTTGSRSSPIPQLRCIDGKSSCKNLPSTVQCYNMGSDGIDVQWRCEAQLPQNVQFDSLQVQCEGYKYPDDPYVLAGSCGLTYSLKPVESSGSSSHKQHRQHHQSSSKRPKSDDASSYSPFLVVVVFLAVCYAIYTFCLAPASRQNHDDSGQHPFPDAPPPYSESAAAPGSGSTPQYGFRPEFTANAGTGSGGGSKYRSYQQHQQQHQQQQSEADTNAADANSGPGFWTGAAIGGLAGYMFGNSGATSTAYHSGGGYHGDSNSSSFGFARTPSSSSSSTTSSHGGGEPVTRTGYGTTRRR